MMAVVEFTPGVTEAVAKRDLFRLRWVRADPIRLCA